MASSVCNMGFSYSQVGEIAGLVKATKPPCFALWPDIARAVGMAAAFAPVTHLFDIFQPTKFPTAVNSGPSPCHQPHPLTRARGVGRLQIPRALSLSSFGWEPQSH